MPGIWSGLLGGYEEHRKTQAEQEAEAGKTAREKANLILKSVLAGDIEATEDPAEAIITGLMGQGYRRVPEKPGKYAPTTQEEALEFERAKAGVKERGARRTEARKGVTEYQKLAAKEGLTLSLAEGLSPQEQLKSALGLYAARPREEAYPEGYQESLSNAVRAIEAGTDPQIVFRKMAEAFPERSSELKRILVPSAKLGELDITDLLWGEK